MNKVDYVSFNEKLSHMVKDNDVNTILILGHINADGDCVGSVLAMSWYIKCIFPEFEIVPYISEIEEGIRKIVDKDQTFYNAFSKPKIEGEYIVIVCDTATKERIYGRELYENAKASIMIDHHLQNNLYADVNFLDYSEACAENIFSAIDWKKLKNKTDNSEAIEMISKYIYLGILHDTSGLKRVGEKTFYIMNKLHSNGVVHKEIWSSMHAVMLQDLKRENTLLEKTIVQDGLAYIFLSLNECIQSGYTYYDLHRLPDILRDCQDIEIAFVLFEEKPGLYKCSMRSKVVDVNELLKEFGGGGHKNAASFKICTDEPAIVLKNLLVALDSILEKK